MLVDGFFSGSLDGVGDAARRLEADGYDGVFTAELKHDPFTSCLLAAEHTEHVAVGTAIAVAFARTPMTVAGTARDLQDLSAGRFVLGLGSQIKAHIERRFSVPWSHPAARMREYVLALRAIWESWRTGGKLDFRGEFYTHTLMTPMFSPGPSAYPDPAILLAGVGDRMTEVSGEVADGMICHPFTTERYVREVTLPAVARGAERAGRTLDGFQLAAPVFVVTATDDAGWERARRATKENLAFYGSTPGYRPVLDLHGWGDLGQELNALSRKGEWVKMGEIVPDAVLETFAVVAGPDDVASALVARYGDVLTRVSFDAPYETDPEIWRGVVAALKAG